MDPLTGTGLILSLIPLFQRERDKRQAAKKEDFFTWLVSHNFADLKDQIQSNYNLSAEIETLLQMNQEQLMGRFDEVDQKLFCIMNSMSEFRSLIKVVAPKAGLTEQEESILRQFVNSGAQYLSNFCDAKRARWLAGSHEIKVKNTLTLNSSLKQLTQKGFLHESSSSEQPYYELTEEANEYVNNINKTDLSDQAKSILTQYVASKQQYLCTLPHGQGQIIVTAENVPIEINAPQFVYDDLDELERHNFIRFDGDLSRGGKRYTLTRNGAQYISNLEI